MNESILDWLDQCDKVKSDVTHKAMLAAREWCEHGRAASMDLQAQLFANHKFTLAESAMFAYQVSQQLQLMLDEGCPAPGLTPNERVAIMGYRIIESGAGNAWFWIQGQPGGKQTESADSFSSIQLTIHDAYQHSMADCLVIRPRSPKT